MLNKWYLSKFNKPSRRSRADSNRCGSFCRALPSRSATGPYLFLLNKGMQIYYQNALMPKKKSIIKSSNKKNSYQLLIAILILLILSVLGFSFFSNFFLSHFLLRSFSTFHLIFQSRKSRKVS